MLHLLNGLVLLLVLLVLLQYLEWVAICILFVAVGEGIVSLGGGGVYLAQDLILFLHYLLDDQLVVYFKRFHGQYYIIFN